MAKYSDLEKKLLEEFEKLGDYHEVDGEDEYEPPSMEETRMFLEKQLPSLLHAYERETEVEKMTEEAYLKVHSATPFGAKFFPIAYNAALEAVENKRKEFWE